MGAYDDSNHVSEEETERYQGISRELTDALLIALEESHVKFQVQTACLLADNTTIDPVSQVAIPRCRGIVV